MLSKGGVSRSIRNLATRCHQISYTGPLKIFASLTLLLKRLFVHVEQISFNFGALWSRLMQQAGSESFGKELNSSLASVQSEHSWELPSIFYSRVKTNELLPSSKSFLSVRNKCNWGFRTFLLFVFLPEIFHTFLLDHFIIKPLRKSQAKISSSLNAAVCNGLLPHSSETSYPPAEQERTALVLQERYRLIPEEDLFFAI